MKNMVRNYDGGITASPAQLVSPGSVGEIQSILRDAGRYPGPVRAMGSYHSLTPCASSDGTIINMSGMERIVEIDRERMTFTAEAGLHFIEASRALRAQNLQFLTNIEILLPYQGRPGWGRVRAGRIIRHWDQMGDAQR
jgi:FAD/FMN-containing dehydrogenase